MGAAVRRDSLPPEEMPTYWFALLEIARGRGDFGEALRAKQELERLGIRITYLSRRKGVRRGDQ